MNGYSYVVAVNGRSQEEAENLVHNVSTYSMVQNYSVTDLYQIQYSRASARGVKKNINSIFLNCSVKKWIWKCSGALICEYLKPSLRTLHHTYLDETMWAEIQNIRKNIDLVENDIQKRNAYRQVLINYFLITYQVLIEIVFTTHRKHSFRKGMLVLKYCRLVHLGSSVIFIL